MQGIRRGFASVAVFVLAAVSACGGDDDGGNGGVAGSSGSAVPFADLPVEFAAVFCEGIQQCLGDLGEIFPQPDCEPNVESEYRNGQFSALEEAVAAGTVVYTGKDVPSCLAAFRALGCGLLASRVPPACEKALAGTIPLGDPCSLNDECEGNAFCDRSGDSCPGVCAEPRAEGQSCEQTSECADGLDCDGSTCARVLTEGQACDDSSGGSCRLGLICVGSSATTTGTCARASSLLSRGIGEACDPLQLDLCEPSLSCVYVGPGFTCQERAASGADCSFGVPEPCPTGEYCNAATVLSGGQCVELPSAGEPCLTGDNRTAPCARNLVCVTGLCVAPQANGSTCESPAECYGDRCVNGVCAGAEFCTQ